MDNTSSFSNPNLSDLTLLTKLYEDYLQDPSSVDPKWQSFFQGWKFASFAYEQFLEKGQASSLSTDVRVFHLIEAYRSFGHLKARFNPLFTEEENKIPELSLENYGFSSLDQEVSSCGFLPKDKVPLKELIDALEKTYAGSIGVEYKGLDLPGLEEFIQERIEPYFSLNLSPERKKEILYYLNRAELFESFIHTKYVGQKRFSLEGCETLIPMLDELMEFGASIGLKEVIIGMAHRGRLNVLTNVMNKPYAHIFHEFESRYLPESLGTSGDVKYHKGFTGKMKTKAGQELDITLAANPSHLEAVDPVVEGMARAKQKGDPNLWKEILPVLIHGDAAVAGQGVVYETLQLGKLEGYATGGSLHIVVNNNIGFTTLPKDSRSTRYCTDIAKAFSAPVFHVNAEDVESCISVIKIALDIRNKFHCDVFVDLNGYRKYGHNEGDEPMFTQPVQCRNIRSRPNIREIYLSRLIEEKVLTEEEAKAEETSFKAKLEDALSQTQEIIEKYQEAGEEIAIPKQAPQTVVKEELLKKLLIKMCEVPAGLHIHPKVERLLKERLATIEQNHPCLDWATAELLAYASLLVETVPIRISGQDVRRGTFSHRHAVWVDQESASDYFPLSNLSKDQATCELYNSSLSEYGVLGFEFGYSIADTSALVIWEAQFGDFSNGAQIVIDQFIASSFTKWKMRSKIALFLPHGYEGQGSEHSSARIERFLQLCADANMRVVNCSTPAQLFHLIRSQALSLEVKPLILFTPKALLRHPRCVSSWKELSEGTFSPFLEDGEKVENPQKIFLCSGKVFYDLNEERKKRERNDVVIIRVEQLYPFDKESFLNHMKSYRDVKDVVWVQEEHENMGAWQYIFPILVECLPGKKISYAGRKKSASPAAGSYALHKKEYEEFMNQAFSI